MVLDDRTLEAWMRRIDEGGQRAVVRTSGPVNHLPDVVRCEVRQLRMLYPEMNKVRSTQVLAWASACLESTTLARILTETEPLSTDSIPSLHIERSQVTARIPDDQRTSI